MPGGRRLVLPLVRKTVVPTPGDAQWASVQASFPHGWGPGGIVAPGGITTADAAFVLADLANAPGLRTTIRPGFVAAEAWGDAWSRDRASRRRGAHETTHVVHVLDLGGGIDKVWSTQMNSKARNGIRNARRQAEKAGLQIEVGTHQSSSPTRTTSTCGGWSHAHGNGGCHPRSRVGEGCGPNPTPVPNRRNGVRRAMPHLGRLPRRSPGRRADRPLHGAIAVGWRASSDRDLVRRYGWTSICSSWPSSMRAKSAASISIWANREGPPGSPISRIELEPPTMPLPSTPSNGCRYLVSRLALSTCGGVSKAVHWHGTGLSAGRHYDQ